VTTLAVGHGEDWTHEGVRHRVIGVYADPETGTLTAAFAPGPTVRRCATTEMLKPDSGWARTWPECDE